MVTKDNLKDYAKKLMFDMDDAGYERTLKEFDVIENQMDLIGKIKNIDTVEPMTFPYVIYHAEFRNDEVEKTLNSSDVLKNSSDTKADQIKVSKVVG